MRAKKRQSLLAVILMLGIGIPGSIGIFAVQAQAGATQPLAQNILQAADTSTPTSTATLQPAASATATIGPLGGSPAPTGPGSARLYAYLQAPSGALERPYVILKAFSSPPRTVPLSIRGFVDSQEFICPTDSCVMFLDGNARFVFRAYSEDGLVSDEVISTVDVTRGQGGYFVTINTVSQFTTFVNACSNIWGIYDEDNVTWDDFVQFPHELNTRKTLHTLATQLLLNGIVDASDCPAGGLSLSLDWPTTRISLARPQGSGRDVVLVRGIEPNIRWRAFCAELLGLAAELGVERIVTLGALLADVPHTRPVPVTVSTSDDAIARSLGLERSRYEGPTGIVGVLQDAAARGGLSATTLWAAVPHYVAQSPCPKATLVLLQHIEDLPTRRRDAGAVD